MIVARAVATPWTLLQVWIYPLPYPPGLKTLGLVLVAVLGFGNLGFFLLNRRRLGLGGARSMALVSLGFDIAIASAFVWLYAFDPTSALWAVLFILPMEGAVRFQLVGALGAWVLVTVLYTLREVWGSARYDYPLDWTSVSYRMGIGLLLAVIAGSMARDLMHQRSLVAAALEEMRRVDQLRTALVSTLAHDVRNPLTTIRGVHQTLMPSDDRLDAKTRRDLIVAADRQAHRLQRLATDLLDLARLEEGRLKLALQDVSAREAIEAALSYVDDGDKIEVSVAEDVKVKADPDRLQQMLVNLATNALRHGRPPFRLEAQRIDGHVSIAVRDHGPGIGDADAATLFQPFRPEGVQGRSSIGFGLAIVKALSEAHGGTVEYEPNEPSGACFNLKLPAAPA